MQMMMSIERLVFHLLDENVIDWYGCVQCCQGDEVTVCQMLALVVEDSLQAKTIFSRYADNAQHAPIRAMLHRLKGCVSYLQLPQLSSCLQDFQQAIVDQDQQRMSSAYTAWQQGHSRIEQVSKLLQERG